MDRCFPPPLSARAGPPLPRSARRATRSHRWLLAATILPLACAWLLLGARPASAQAPVTDSCVEDVVLFQDVYIGHQRTPEFAAKLRAASSDLLTYIQNLSRTDFENLLRAFGFNGSSAAVEAIRQRITRQLSAIMIAQLVDIFPIPSPLPSTGSPIGRRIPFSELADALKFMMRVAASTPYAFEIKCSGGGCALHVLTVGNASPNSCVYAGVYEYGTPRIDTNRFFVLSESSRSCDRLTIDGPNIDAQGNGWAAINGLAAGSYTYSSTCCIVTPPEPPCRGPGGRDCRRPLTQALLTCVNGPSQQVLSNGNPAFVPSSTAPPAPPDPPQPPPAPLPPIAVSGTLHGCVGNGFTHHTMRWTPHPSNPPGSIVRYEIWYQQGTPGFRFGWSRASTQTPAYVRGAAATARIRACSATTCSGLSSASYVATSTCVDGGGGGAGKPAPPPTFEMTSPTPPTPPPPRPPPVGPRDPR